jgi:hypothetical protein
VQVSLMGDEGGAATSSVASVGETPAALANTHLVERVTEQTM